MHLRAALRQLSIVTILCCASSTLSVALAQECAPELNIFRELVKGRRYEEALPKLAFLRTTCQSYSTDLYAYAERMYGQMMRSSAVQPELAEELIQLHYDRIEYLPYKTDRQYFLGKIALLMHKHGIGKKQEQLIVFQEAAADEWKTTYNPEVLYAYFTVFHELASGPDGNLSSLEVQQLYDEIQVRYTIQAERLSSASKQTKTKLMTLQLIELLSGKMTTMMAE